MITSEEETRFSLGCKNKTTPFERLYTSTQQFLDEHPPAVDSAVLLTTLPKRWSLYPPLVLLPRSSFASPEWTVYLDSLPEQLRTSFYSQIATALRVTHLALSAPIQSTAIRSPNITPLYGGFGPVVFDGPTQVDFERAFWVTAAQNGIKQIWAPMYTMFSRGNITEKARVLEFPDVKGQEIADLFVGIGYFAFSYLKAGAKRVWGWDLNPWSVEGLRRGAEINGWTCTVNPSISGDGKLVVFNEDNVAAVKRLTAVGVKVKHVNLGLLPSSRCAWKTASEILDEKGGWIHVHGNCRETEFEMWTCSVLEEFRNIFKDDWTLSVIGWFRVKMFGPGIGHWVLDLHCSKQQLISV